MLTTLIDCEGRVHGLCPQGGGTQSRARGLGLGPGLRSRAGCPPGLFSLHRFVGDVSEAADNSSVTYSESRQANSRALGPEVERMRSNLGHTFTEGGSSHSPGLDDGSGGKSEEGVCSGGGSSPGTLSSG